MSWHEVHNAESATKDVEIYYMWPAIVKIGKRSGKRIQQVIVKAKVGVDFEAGHDEDEDF